MTAYYHNEALFSEIYLEEITRLPEHEDVLASLRVLREYRDYADTSSLAAWTQSYIHEVLAALGFTAQVKRPGLTLLHPIGSFDQPVSLCVVTLPTENLDETRMGRNWAEKIIRALREQAMQWGLLTNGKIWRIYHADEATPYETYLEIDLEQILSDQARDAYQIFHKFMKAGNFAVGEAGKCQFDRFKKESKDKIDYIEKELSNALKQREEGGKGVLSDLCMGYVEEVRHSGEYDLDDEVVRRKIYHGAMLYMFRLLFLFYADARGLLSDENEVLFTTVKADARALHNGERLPGGGYALWERLSAIFVDIDQTYNGGLFSPQESEFTQFIEETRAGDRYLAETLFNLTTYYEKNGQDRPISYRDMSVRHLGTLYEGLLEHKLFITAEATEVRVAKGRIEFIPASRGGKLTQGHTLAAGAVYFAGDPSERKSTGSYYTPEYIVDYIVRNTVGEKLKTLKAEFSAQEKANLSALARAVDADERAALAGLLEENALQFVREKILTLSVLDPAMGSGHFLVNVTNLIANFICEFLNDLGIEGETESGAAYWRRWVVENCIYGVDLNPLAVELAKLGLWILSMAKDQPLSFMNHHLKCGNSLVGARLDEIGNYPFSTAKKEPRQLKMFERDPNFRAAVEDALAKSRLIASRASTSLADVEEKKAWLAEIEADLKGYKAICNVHTGLYFGNQVDETDYTRLVEKRDFAIAFALGSNNQYFHWELEFPEVLLSFGGFSCVIGNPPYGGDLSSLEKKYLFFSFINAQDENLDTYEAFILKGLELGKYTEGKLSFILPSTWLYMPTYQNLRKLIISTYMIEQVVHFRIPVFQGVTVETCIAILKNSAPSNNHELLFSEVKDSLENFYSFVSANQLQTLKSPSLNLYFKDGDLSEKIYKKIASNSTPLGNLAKIVCGIKPYQKGKGKPKQTEDSVSKRIFDANYKVNDSYRQYIMGRDFHKYRWQIEDERWLSYGDWLAEPRYGAPFDAQEKIVIRRTADEIIAHLDRNQYLTQNSVHNLVLKTDAVNLNYILALLNSKLMTWWYCQLMPAKGRVFAEVKIVNLEQLPIRKLDLNNTDDVTINSQIQILVTQLVELYQKPYNSEIKRITENIDQLIYQLYKLTEDEIVVIEKES